MAFEIVDISLEERSKLRRLLADNLGSAPLPENDTTTSSSETLVPAGSRTAR
jgi:hypothetical protein